jgi:hypothetical protein
MKHKHFGKSRDPYKENRPKDRGQQHIVERETQRSEHERLTDHHDESIPGQTEIEHAAQSRHNKWRRVGRIGTGRISLGRGWITKHKGPKTTFKEWREQERAKRRQIVNTSTRAKRVQEINPSSLPVSNQAPDATQVFVPSVNVEAKKIEAFLSKFERLTQPKKSHNNNQ